MIAIAGIIYFGSVSAHAQLQGATKTKKINNTIVPANLVSFDAQLTGKKIMVNWVINAEKNTSHYIIQRSIDGKSFDDSGIIFTDENSNGEKQYSFPNNTNFVNKGKVYYRLKIVDMNSKSKYSNIVVVRLTQSQMALLACSN
ncbi:MAG: hypothetical protein JST96_05990 [Bacteroidetes bacterium]|nr:hypothetical protein [Bacteroidota bacterium]